MSSNYTNSLETLFSKMENFVSTKTVVGEPTQIGDVIIVPLVDVAVGVGAGTNEAKGDKNGKEMGAGGLGAKISPSAVMVIQNGTVQLVNVKNQNSVNKLIDMVPGILAKLDFTSAIKKNAGSDSANSAEKAEAFKDERIVEDGEQ